MGISIFICWTVCWGGGGGGFSGGDSIRCNLPWHGKLRSADTEKREMKEDFWCFVESAPSTNVGYTPFQHTE